MTIMAKTGSSVDGSNPGSPLGAAGPASGSGSASGDKSNLYVYAGSSTLPAPPSYAETIEADAEDPPLPRDPPVNFLCLKKSNGKIQGHWDVDTSLLVPTALLPKLSWLQSESARPHLALETSNGMVVATVGLVSGARERVRLKVFTQNGKIWFSLPKRENDQPFKADLKTQMGSVTVGLPRSFTGPIKYKTSWGNITFSDGLRTTMRAFTGDTGFVGDWKAAGFVDYDKWSGDEVEAFTQCGAIRFAYADELDAEEDNGFEKSLNNALNGLKKWFGY